MNVRKFKRKVAAPIKAVQWTEPDQALDIVEWANRYAPPFVIYAEYDGRVAGPSHPETGDDWGQLVVYTLNGDVDVRPSDWVIQGTKNEFYPCDAEIFADTYEEVME